MKSKLVLAAMLAAAVGFTSCQKDDLGTNGPSTMGVKIEALNKSYSLPVSGGTKSAEVTGATLQWDTVHMLVSQIQFQAELKSLTTHRDSIEIEYKWSGPQMVDLLNDKLTMGNFILQPGFYDEIELKVYGDQKDAGKNPVFYMSGSYSNTQDTKIPVVLKVFGDVEFKTEKDSVSVTAESIDFTSYVQIYLDQLLAGIDPSRLDYAKLNNGVIVISPDSNRDIYFTIFANLIRNHHCYLWHKGKGDYKH